MVRAEGGSLRFWGPGLLSTSPAFSMSSASHSAGSSGWLAPKTGAGPNFQWAGKVDPDRIEQGDHVQAASFAPYKSSHPIHLKHSIFFQKFLRYELMCSDFIKCSKELTHRFLRKGYPMTTMNKQWQNVVDIQRVNLLKCKEIKASGRLPIIHTYHQSVQRVNKTIIKEFRNYSKLTSSKHPFDVTPICAYRQPSNLRDILIRSNFSHTITSTGNKNCEKTRCQICNIITTDTEINIPGTSHICHPENYNCDSSNIVYLLMLQQVQLR